MSTGYQIKEQEELHYVTLQIVKWIDIFTRQIYRDIIIENLRFCQMNKGLEIYAYVIMSNHVNLLIRSSIGKLSDKFIQQKINYIHENPVKSGIVEKPEDYLYSSARNYAGMAGLIDVIYIPPAIEKF